MKLRDMIENHTVITVQVDDNLDLAMQMMLWGGVRHLPVLDRDRLVGILSQRDIVTHQAKVGTRIAARSLAKEIMSVPPITASPDEDDERALELMVKSRIGCVPVIERGRLLGIVTRSDFLAEQMRATREERDEAPAHGPEVSSIMNTDVAVAAADDNLLDAVARMQSRGVRHLPVIDGDRRVIGMLSDRDVRTAVGNTLRPLERGDATVRMQSMRVQNAMSRRPYTVPQTATVTEVAREFVDHRIGAVPVVDADGRLQGMVSYVDVLAALVPRTERNGAPAPTRQAGAAHK